MKTSLAATALLLGLWSYAASAGAQDESIDPASLSLLDVLSCEPLVATGRDYDGCPGSQIAVFCRALTSTDSIELPAIDCASRALRLYSACTTGTRSREQDAACVIAAEGTADEVRDASTALVARGEVLLRPAMAPTPDRLELERLRSIFCGSAPPPAGCSADLLAALCATPAPTSMPTDAACTAASWRRAYGCARTPLSETEEAICSVEMGSLAGARIALLDRGVFGLGAAGSITRSTSVEGMVLNGLTDFFVARAGQEAALFLHRTLAADLCSSPDGNPGVGVQLLPRTCGVLRPGGDDPEGTSLFGLPQAFRADLDSLPATLPGVLLTIAGEDPARRALACAAPFVGAVVSQLRTQHSLGLRGLFTALGAATPPDGCEAPWTQMPGYAQIISSIIVQLDEWRESRPGQRMTEGQVSALLTLVAASPQLEPAQRAWIVDAAPRLQRLAASVIELRSASDSAPTQRARIIEFARATMGVVEHLVTTFADPQSAAGVADNLRLLTEAGVAIAEHEYLDAMAQLLALPVLRAAIANLESAPLREGLQRLVQYGGLIAGVASAQSSEEIQDLLEDAAAPLQSYRTYRRGIAGFVAGHLGIAGGGEFLLGGAPGGVLGAALPIGFELGFPTDPYSRSSFLVGVSLIDLGTLASARLDGIADQLGADGQPRVDPVVDFLTVLSPGLWVMVGIDDSPFAVGVMGQYFPSARRVYDCAAGEATCDTYSTLGGFRVQAMLSIDMPVLRVF